MLYCGKPPREKYKKTGENIKKHDLFIYFYLFLSIFLSAPTAHPAERLSGLNGIERRFYFFTTDLTDSTDIFGPRIKRIKRIGRALAALREPSGLGFRQESKKFV